MFMLTYRYWNGNFLIKIRLYVKSIHRKIILPIYYRKGRGEVMRKSYGVQQSECFPRPIVSQREVTNVCIKLGYRSGTLVDGSKPSQSQFVPRNDFYMFQLNNNIWMTMRNDVSFGVWKKPENNCYRLFVQCF
jgi:hypothetical protein